MSNILSLGYSTCPNDTFIFYPLAHNLIDCKGIKFNIRMDDVETLNQNAKKGYIDVSKLSFAAIGHLQDSYGLLRSGTALGHGCGPLIIARPGADLNDIKKKQVAVPGLWTTACLLLSLFISGKPNIVPMPFDRIMPAVYNGHFDFGVIIHEGRFTYHEYGLVNLLDLGRWWEEKTSLPIPLGGIAIHRKLGKKIAKKVETAIQKSVLYAFKNRGMADNYIKKHAQEMSWEVIKQHIDLYVNNFTLEIEEEGKDAIDKLFDMARARRIIPQSRFPLFAC